MTLRLPISEIRRRIDCSNNAFSTADWGRSGRISRVTGKRASGRASRFRLARHHLFAHASFGASFCPLSGSEWGRLSSECTASLSQLSPASILWTRPVCMVWERLDGAAEWTDANCRLKAGAAGAGPGEASHPPLPSDAGPLFATDSSCRPRRGKLEEKEKKKSLCATDTTPLVVRVDSNFSSLSCGRAALGGHACCPSASSLAPCPRSLKIGQRTPIGSDKHPISIRIYTSQPLATRAPHDEHGSGIAPRASGRCEVRGCS